MLKDMLNCCLAAHLAKSSKNNNIEDLKKSNLGASDGNTRTSAPLPAAVVLTIPYQKCFTPRESPLTEIFSSKHGSSLYIIIMVLSIMAFSSSALASVVNNEELQVGHLIMWYNVKGVPVLMACWAVIYSLVLLLYFIFRLWASKRPLCKAPFACDAIFTLPVVTICGLLVLFPAGSAWWLELPPVCRFGLLMEQIRFFLKIYSMFHAKIPDVMTGSVTIPGFKDILVYFAAPTMIFKDEYPRSSQVRWRVCLLHCFELMWTGVIGSYLLEKVHTPAVIKFRSVWLDAGPMLISLISNLVPTTLILLVGFFGYFHSFCNLTAELTRFEDRLFYKDWWNTCSFKTFFRSWNTLIQDWLYLYVYLDIRRTTRNPQLAAAAVFFVSGVLHEYVLSFFFGFFYPVMAVIFVGVGSILKAIPTASVSSRFGNLVLWLCIPMGSAIMFTSYMAEINSRINCPYPIGMEHWSDYVIPRSWSCPLTE